MKVEFEKNEDPNVMAQAYAHDGTEIVVMTAPASTIDGDGPIVIPTFDEKVIIVVYSEKFVMGFAPNEDDSMKEVGAKMNQFSKIIANGVVTGRKFVAESK